ncbi:MAG: hypothetical protein ABIT38_17510, partial [Gemmatimonadaceae bacterium]
TMRRVAYEMAFENWRTSSATSGERFPNDSALGQRPENALHRRIVVGRLQAPTELAQSTARFKPTVLAVTIDRTRANRSRPTPSSHNR